MSGHGKRLKNINIWVISALAVAFFFPVWGMGQYFLAFDYLRFFFPWYLGSNHVCNNGLISDPIFHNYLSHLLSRQTLFNGEYSWWRSDIFSGLPMFPFEANPLGLLCFILLPVPVAMMLLSFIHLLLAGLMMYLFLRCCRMVRPAALAGAIAWMFNGYVMVWFEYEFSLAFAAVLPATLFFVERWWRKGGAVNWVAVCLCHAYAIAVGFPHLLIYYFIFFGIYVVWRTGADCRRGSLGVFAKNATGLMVTVFPALLTGLALVLNSINGLLAGQRQAFSFSELYAYTGQVHWQFLVTLFFPELLSSPLTSDNYIPAGANQLYNNFNELCIYVGFTTLVLALVGLFGRWRGRNLFFAATAIFSLWSAMGGWVYYPLAKLVPGLAFSTPTRILFFWGFSLAFLAATGMQVLICGRRRRWIPAVIDGIALVSALVLLAIVNTDWGCRLLNPVAYKALGGIPIWVRPTSLHIYLPLAAILTGGGLLLAASCAGNRMTIRWLSIGIIAVMAIELFSFGMRYNTRTVSRDIYPETPGIAFLKAQPKPFRVMYGRGFTENGLSPFGIESIGGYMSIYPRRYGEYIQMLKSGSPELKKDLRRIVAPSSGIFSLISLLNVRYLLLDPSAQVKHMPQLELVYRGEINIYRNHMCLPRIFWVPKAIRCRDDQELRERLCKSSLSDLTQFVLLEKGHDGISEPASADNESQASHLPEIHIKSYRSDEIELETKTASDGYLVIGNSYDPGWKVMIDEWNGVVERGNYALQAVRLPWGRHRVKLYYQPVPMMTAVKFGYLAWGGLGLLLLVSWWRKKRCKD